MTDLELHVWRVASSFNSAGKSPARFLRSFGIKDVWRPGWREAIDIVLRRKGERTNCAA